MGKDAIRGALIVAAGALLEAIRKRLLLVGLAFSIALVLLSVAAASVSIGEQARLIIDVGLAASSGFGSIIALALVISTFAQAIKNRTVYPVLVRPLPRWAFVLGKYLGNVAAMIIVISVMVWATAVVVWLYGDQVPSALWWAWWLNCVEMALVAAIATLFCTMSSPVLAATYTVGIVLAGNLADEITGIAEGLSDRGKALGTAMHNVYYLVPDLQELSVRAQASNDLPVPTAFVFHGTMYGLSYACVALLAAMWIFSRREML